MHRTGMVSLITYWQDDLLTEIIGKEYKEYQFKFSVKWSRCMMLYG